MMMSARLRRPGLPKRGSRARRRRERTRWLRLLLALCVGSSLAGSTLVMVSRASADRLLGDLVQCANLIYAGTKTSKCFSDRFLKRLSLETNIQTDGKFSLVRLSSDELFKYPFAVMTGEGSFTLTDAERVKLKEYLTRGGFLLASAGCSDENWGASFRREMKRIFPKHPLRPLPISHSVFHTVYDITSINTSHHDRSTRLEGISIGGRLAVVFSQDGLNDTAHTQNCCCCGGDEIRNAEFINVNVLAYALMH